MRKKIVFLAKVIDSGGVSSTMLELGKNLHLHNWEVYIISGGQSGKHQFSKEKFESENISYLELPFLRQELFGLIKFPVNVFRFCKSIREINPDIIHVHWRSVSIYAKASEVLLKIPFVSTIHLNEIPHSFIHRLVSFWGEKVIVISTETAEFMTRVFHIPKSRQILIFNGVDNNKFKIPDHLEKCEARRYFKIDEGCFVISCLARLEEVKGHKTIIEALVKLNPIFRENIIVIFGGEGSLESRLKKEVASVGLNRNFLFLGHADSCKVLKASDVFILTSYKEGFPVSVVEAMFSGVPVIRTPSEGAYDQIDDAETGILVNFDDPDALKDKIELLYKDRVFLKYLKTNAFIKAKNSFTNNEMCFKTIETYFSVISNLNP